MKFITGENPKNPGLYGILRFGDYKRNLPDSFQIAYFDGEGWKLPSEADIEIAPYRSVEYWCYLEIGK